MVIRNVLINGINEPIGFLYETLRVSWEVEETESVIQKNARIEIGTTPDFKGNVYAKEGQNLKQSGTIVTPALVPRTIYYVRVSVEGDKGDKNVSSVSTFETGKMGEPFNAEWIATQKEDTFHPILQRKFTVSKHVSRVRYYGTGVGLFELYLNGEKAGNEYLMPYITNYEERLQIMTIVPENIHIGENKLEIVLGNGWYMGTFGLELQTENYGSHMAAIGELHLEYEDGTKEVINTDKSWEYRGSDIEASGIYDGEVLNRLLWYGRENPLKPVEVISNPENERGYENLNKAHLRDRLSLPVIVKEKISATELIMTPAGEEVLDFGQNFAGLLSFHSKLPRGTRVKLEVGEILQQGSFYHKNYRDAKSEFIYISDGREEDVIPHFTYFGFRYIKVTGWVGELRKEDFNGLVLYSDLARTGYLQIADKKVDRLYKNVIWGQKSNFIDIPTDCPQRSERLGWTGDTQVFASTGCYNMDTRAFYHKFIQDLKDEQLFLSGGVPNYLPNIGHKKDCGSVWGDIATLLPDTLFEFYGCIEEASFCYQMMKDWVDYIDRHDAARGEKKYLFDFGFCFGDWLALDGVTSTSFKGGTDDVYISSVYYFRSAQIVGQTAEKLGKVDDAVYYENLAMKIRGAVLTEFFTPSGRLAIDTQAAYVIALKFGIYINKERLIVQFRERLKKDRYQIRCGFVGAPLLCTVLAENGMVELAWDLLLREDFPSWLYEVNLGATTVWERWNSVGADGTISDTGMNSLNHYAYGSVMEFVYAYAAGIRPGTPGFASAIIAPNPDIRVPEVKCSYNSVNGEYQVHWKINQDGTLTIEVKVPFNCAAKLELPESDEEQKVLQAGEYKYSYQPMRDFRKPYSGETTLERLSGDERAMAVLFELTPALGGMAAGHDPEMSVNTLDDFKTMTFLPIDQDKLRQAIDRISELIVEPGRQE